MPSIADQAIVLRRLDYSESSLVLVFFTREYGKVRAIAKGARRSTKTRFSPGIDLLEAGQLVVSVRHPGQEALAILTEWKPARTFAGLREKIERWHAAQYVVDVITSLTEDWDPHPDLYATLERGLAALSDVDDVLGQLVEFQTSTLDATGLTPRLDKCVGCGRAVQPTADIYFSSFDGGLICRDCEPAQVEKRLVRVAVSSLLGSTAPSRADTFGLFDLYNYHISHTMGRSPASYEYFECLIPERPGGKPRGGP